MPVKISLVFTHSKIQNLEEIVFYDTINTKHIGKKANKSSLRTHWIPYDHPAQSAGAVEYTDCISAEWKESPSPTSVQDMTLKHWWRGSRNTGALGNAEYLIASPLRLEVVAPD